MPREDSMDLVDEAGETKTPVSCHAVCLQSWKCCKGKYRHIGSSREKPSSPHLHLSSFCPQGRQGGRCMVERLGVHVCAYARLLLLQAGG